MASSMRFWNVSRLVSMFPQWSFIRRGVPCGRWMGTRLVTMSPIQVVTTIGAGGSAATLSRVPAVQFARGGSHDRRDTITHMRSWPDG